MIWPALALVALFALCTTVGPTASTEVNDLYLYRSVAGLLEDGRLPYLDFAFEYPPLAAVPLGLAIVPGGGEDGYAITFALLMLGCALALQRWIYGIAGARAAWAVVLMPVLVGASLRTHFDLLPAALVAGALLLFARGRPVPAFAVLGVGTLAKLFPALLVPIAAAWLLGRGERRAALHGVLAFTVVVLAVSLPFLGDGYVEQARFHLERPVQIESTPATVLFALGDSYVTGDPVRPDRFRSNGLDGGPADGVALLFTLLLAGTLLGIVALARRGGGFERLFLCSFAAVVAFIALGKVLSPQFVIWLVPFAAVAAATGHRALAALCALAMVLTAIEFPTRYFDLVDRDTAVVLVVAARNAVLLATLALTLAKLAAPARSRSPGNRRIAPARP
jgi:hypothetical protein